MPPLFCQEVKMNKHGYNYRVEVEFWTRSHDGDDWITGSSWFTFDSLAEAVHKASNPYTTTKDIIESRILDMNDSKYGTVIWEKDWHNNTITSYNTSSNIKQDVK